MTKAAATAEAKTELHEGALPLQQPTVTPAPVAGPQPDFVLTCQHCDGWKPLSMRPNNAWGQCIPAGRAGAVTVIRADLDPACSQAILPKG